MYLCLFIISLLLTIAAVPQVKKIAFFLNAIDKPEARKVHGKLMPRMGGFAIFMGFLVSVLIGLLWAGIIHMKFNYLSVLGILIGATIIVLIGIVDDIRGMRALNKLIFQLVAAYIPIMFGVQISFISAPLMGMILLGIFAVPVTLIWIVGMTNAVNFIDGLDGLASGISAIASFTLFIVAVRIHQPAAAILMIALCGATIGFLKFNFNPASIFLGDTGSLLLGYVLAVSTVIGVLKSTIILSLLVPVFILGVPVFDAASVIMRRVKDGRHIFDADRKHLHHRLLDKGFSHKQVVISIYLVCLLLSIATLSITFLRVTHALLLLALVAIAVFIIISQIKKYIRRYVVIEER